MPTMLTQVAWKLLFARLQKWALIVLFYWVICLNWVNMPRPNTKPFLTWQFHFDSRSFMFVAPNSNRPPADIRMLLTIPACYCHGLKKILFHQSMC